MSFTMGGWLESKDTAAVLAELAAIADQSLTTLNNDILVPNDWDKLLAAYALGATMTQAQISSPRLRKETLVDLPIFEANANPQEHPRFLDLSMRPRQLDAGEGLRALVAEAAAGAELEVVLAWLINEVDPMPPGAIQWIRATSATTLVANVWTICTMILTQQLEAGTYAVVGMRAVSATGIAARIVFSGLGQRPGVPVFTSEIQADLGMFKVGKLGNWGEFEHTFLPQIEFLATAGDTAEEVYFALIKVE